MASPFKIYNDDALFILSILPSNSVDAIVTDPPYGISFMGKAWDGADIVKRAEYRRGFESHAPNAGPNGGHKSIAAEAGKYDLSARGMRAFQSFSEEWASEALRVLKPGGHLLCFAAARTYHRMASGVEDAGFEIRDQIMWVFGSGFPKSHNLQDAHKGWGTALKPAHEPIILARKPLLGTVAETVVLHGTGALNIDGCRVPGEPWTWGQQTDIKGGNYNTTRPSEGAVLAENVTGGAEGRWPANFIHDGSAEVLAAFPQTKSGTMKAGTRRAAQDVSGSVCYGIYGGNATADDTYGDAGNAARFFYCAKASKKDRDEGLEAFEKRSGGMVSNTSGQHMTRRDEGYAVAPRANNHPTVKPTELMRYLCRLITPPGGTVLDPFMGSGSTGKAAMLEGFQFVGIEREAEYVAIATARIEAAINKQ